MNSIPSAKLCGFIVAMTLLAILCPSVALAQQPSAGDQFSKRVGDWFRRNLYGETNPGYGPPPGSAPRSSVFGGSQPQAPQAPQTYYPAAQQNMAPTAPTRPMGYPQQQYATPQAPVYQQAPTTLTATKTATASKAPAKSSAPAKKRSYSPPQVREEQPVASYQDTPPKSSSAPAKQTVVTAPTLSTANKNPSTSAAQTSPEAARAAAISASFTGLSPYADGFPASSDSQAPKSSSGNAKPAPPPAPATTAKKEASAPTPTATAGNYPIGSRTDKAGRVVSPFPPNTELDVGGMASGSLALDPITNQVFRIP